MSGEQKFWLWFFGIIATVVCVFAITIAVYYRASEKDFIANGYTQEILPGSSVPRWIKR